MQAEALKACFSEHWDRGPIEALLPVAQLEAWIQRSVLRTLKTVPFDKSAEDLVPNTGSCDRCQKRTGANSLLFPEIDSDSCLDGKCLQSKIDAHVQSTVTAQPELVQISTTACQTKKAGPIGIKDAAERMEFYRTWSASGRQATGERLRRLRDKGIIDQDGKRIATHVPPDMLDADSTVEQ